ncbi:hypothetical protein G4177_32325 [Corallococcus sp. ZKHCc1 1396]|uniref:Lipoprotein n=1 Tax=Corallococcus soli TaxID=2710757 RepID=A0ABR9PY59_9BACT|nr:hypothetical protein [Corallococcus soli]MBE4752848.1 hypothetical protein [Corallococcus soli]
MFANFFKTLTLSAMVAVPLAACGGMEGPIDEAGAEEAALGQREDAFTGNWSYSWGDTQLSTLDIGTSVNRTCFLTGIGGHLRPVGAFLYSDATYPAMAGVRKNASGNYELYVQPAAGKHLIAHARCVNSAANRVEVSWTTGQQTSLGDKVIGPANGTRQCFLQDVKNFPVTLKDSNGDIYGYGWAFDDKPNPDEVRVFNDGTYWKLTAKAGVHSYPVNFHVSAVCVDATQDLGNWNWKAGDPGTAQINLTNEAGATCGLTGVRGAFAAAFGDWDDAVSISNTGSQFTLHLANGKRGWGGCMK